MYIHNSTVKCTVDVTNTASDIKAICFANLLAITRSNSGTNVASDECSDGRANIVSNVSPDSHPDFFTNCFSNKHSNSIANSTTYEAAN